jgi:hypothetical protein
MFEGNKALKVGRGPLSTSTPFADGVSFGCRVSDSNFDFVVALCVEDILLATERLMPTG